MPADEVTLAPRPPITDSPWLWFSLFTAVALAALLATGGKFGKRQANIENKYQARSAVASGALATEPGAAGSSTAAARPAYSTPDDVIIPIWPLQIILGLMFLASLGMLLRQRFG